MTKPCASTLRRHGLGLIEVIVCTALVAVMIIPIAGVIHASGQSIARANGSSSTEAELRRGLRWLGDSIRDGNVLSVGASQMQIRLRSGDVVTARVQGGKLLLNDGISQTTLVENAANIRFTELKQTTPPRTRIGVSIISACPRSGHTCLGHRRFNRLPFLPKHDAIPSA